MERYVQQLLADIAWARENVPEPWWHFVAPDEEEDEEFSPWSEDVEQAPRKSLEEWTGIRREQLPPAHLLSQRQLERLLEALKEMLSAYNCHVVFQQADIPEQVQYDIIRRRFDQEVPQLRTNDYFFEFCAPGEDSTCLLGQYCECRFLDHVLTHSHDGEEEEEDTYEEPGLQDYYLRRKYGRDWEHYLPQHDWEDFEEDFPEEEDPGWWEDEEEDW